jgi:FkbM family methyltransferase
MMLGCVRRGLDYELVDSALVRMAAELMTHSLLRNLISRPSSQALWLKLLKLSHAGLNYGGGQTVEESGEVEALRFVRDLQRVPGPFTLFDVGANDGGYLSRALETLGKAVTVYSFEPQSVSFEVLRRRYADDPRVKLREVALGKVSGRADLFFGVAGDTMASLNPRGRETQSHSESVALMTIDEVCAAEKIGHIDLLKIDTEGFEMDVLIGAQGMIGRGAVGAIQFEFGDTFLRMPYHFIDFWELLSKRFTMYRILRRGLHRLDRHTSDLEIYKIANFLCVSKS